MKKKIALLTGGYSGEAEISYQSVITVNNNIDRNKFDVYLIDIKPEGWLYKDENGEDISIDKNNFSLTLQQEKIYFDAVLMCIHGTPGEDGKLQGYFDCIGLPYTTCDATTSALTFNKRFTVAVAAFSGINVARSMHIFRNDVIDEEEIINNLKFPVFVKPNNGGSSIGMSKVDKPSEEIGFALQKAFNEDDQVLIEEFIEGREFTIGVFKSKGEIITLPITEVRSKKKFFDFEAKYKGLSEETTPAIADESILNKVRAAAKKIYAIFNCKGVIRIDFIYNEEKGAPFMLEINTVPGQSAASIVPQQIKAMGWTLEQFYTALIEECWN
ncbi:MAG: D-alanine--D-alanine ligase [Bacteroidetes bacterium]|nr:D-alanine--D-alanine ligase [Bacteroidota bacterium]